MDVNTSNKLTNAINPEVGAFCARLGSTIPPTKTCGNRPLWRQGFTLFAFSFAVALFGTSPASRAVTPPPDGGYPNQNTAEGDDALFSLTVGANNTALGFEALFNDQNGTNNTAVGYLALFANVTAHDNTAIGFRALESGDGINNTAVGSLALNNNNSNNNTAVGSGALFNNNGFANTAVGSDALEGNLTGNENIAIGFATLQSNVAGSNNIAVGFAAGGLVTGSNNIDIDNPGKGGESNSIRIGTKGIHTAAAIAGISTSTIAGGAAVFVNRQGRLGIATSSSNFKEKIKPMNNASETILALKPVTFRYKYELDPDGIPQFGLVAEQVEKVNPALVTRDDQGKPYTVRYEAVNAMLLNEFLKEHRRVEAQGLLLAKQLRRIEEQEGTINEFKSAIAQQQKKIKALTAGLQKVSNQIELTKPAARVVADN
jgi:hypothetical protein